MDKLLEKVRERTAASRASTQSIDEKKQKVGKASYSWITNPAVFGVESNQFNAKNLPFSEIGVGLLNYGFNEDNIFDKIEQSRAAKSTGDKTGGYLTIYDGIINQTETYSDKNQAALMRSFMETGDVPPGLTMDTILHHADYGLRHNARKQQRKKKGFFSGNIGSIIGAIGGAAIGFVASGFNPAGAVAGAKAGGAAGGAGQAINENRGLLGTAMAGVGGYGIGSLGSSIGQAASATATNVGREGLRQGLSTSARTGIASLGESLKNTLLNPIGAVKGTFQGIYNDLINPLVQTGKGVYSGIGSLANPNISFSQGFRAGFYGPSSAGIGSLSTPDFATRQVIDATPSNIIETPEFANFDAISPDLGLEGLDSSFVQPEFQLINELNPDILKPGFNLQTQPVMATEQITGPVRSGSLTGPQPPGTQLRMVENTNEMLRTGQGLGVDRQLSAYLPEVGQSSTLPTTTQVGTFNPEAVNLSGYADQLIPTETLGPRFVGAVGDNFANPITGRYGTIEGDLARAGTLDPYIPTPEPYFGQLGVPATLATGEILEDALTMPTEPQSGEEQSTTANVFPASRPRILPQVERFVTPLSYVYEDRLNRPQYYDFDVNQGALGRRLYDTNVRPSFAEGGSVNNNVDSKFFKYESGKKSIQSNLGENEERGFTKISGTGIDPIEETYIKRPMGLEDFFQRTPEGRFKISLERA